MRFIFIGLALAAGLPLSATAHPLCIVGADQRSRPTAHGRRIGYDCPAYARGRYAGEAPKHAYAPFAEAVPAPWGGGWGLGPASRDDEGFVPGNANGN